MSKIKYTVTSFQKLKNKNEKIVVITAYDFATASMVDQCSVHAILVGDSLGMVCLGYKDTVQVTLEDIIYHTKSVRRANPKALLIADMPFMSYHTTVVDAVKNAGRLLQEAGAEAVKLEGGARVVSKIKAIVNAQIPVMGHIGLTPQSVHMLGGYKVQGKTPEVAKALIEDAKKIEDAGAFAIVLECVPDELAGIITSSVNIPTIGIGAGNLCGGQVLVFHDMLNINAGPKKKFVKIFADAGSVMQDGIMKYVKEVQDGTFPSKDNAFEADDGLVSSLYGGGK